MTRWDRWTALHAGALALWLTAAALTCLAQPVLGHDEARFALDTRDWFAGAPSRWFYVAPGMRLVTLPGLAAGGSELALRVVSSVASAAFLVALSWLGRATVGRSATAWAALALAGMHAFARWNADVMSDLPSGACVLAALALLTRELLIEPAPRRRLLLVAPLAAAAFYLRWGSVVPLALAGGAVVVVAPGVLRAHARLLGALLLLLLVLLAPHLLDAVATTGTPWGIVTASSAVPSRAYVGEGLVGYVTSKPWQLYGVLAAPLLLLGIGSALTTRQSWHRVLWLFGVSDVVVLGLLTHMRVRYIYVGVAVLVLLGCDQLGRLLVRLAPRARRAASVSVLTVMLGVAVNTLVRLPAFAAGRSATMRASTAAARVIRADAHGEPCLVRGGFELRVEWYAGCGPLVEPAPTGVRVYHVRDESPAWRQSPQPDVRALPGLVTTLLLLPGLVTVARADAPH